MTSFLLYLLMLLFSLGGIALNIVALPGNWLMLILAVGFSALHHWTAPSLLSLVIMLGLLLAGEVFELAGSMIGAKKFGASRTATVAAILGAVVGAIVGTPVYLIGNLIGAILGAFLAAWTVEILKRRPFDLATKAALGAALGRTTGLFAKVILGLAAFVVLAVTAWPW